MKAEKNQKFLIEKAVRAARVFTASRPANIPLALRIKETYKLNLIFNNEMFNLITVISIKQYNT